MILDLTSDLLVKVICDFQGQSYTKHAISALLLPVETAPVGLRSGLGRVGFGVGFGVGIGVGFGARSGLVGR